MVFRTAIVYHTCLACKSTGCFGCFHVFRTGGLKKRFFLQLTSRTRTKPVPTSAQHSENFFFCRIFLSGHQLQMLKIGTDYWLLKTPKDFGRSDLPTIHVNPKTSLVPFSRCPQAHQTCKALPGLPAFIEARRAHRPCLACVQGIGADTDSSAQEQSQVIKPFCFCENFTVSLTTVNKLFEVDCWWE